MRFDDFYMMILEVLPNATLGEDNDGQIIVYTNYKMTNPEEVEDIDYAE